jgi:hypothetical protein
LESTPQRRSRRVGNNIDELIAFANERRWRKSVLAYAEKYADTAWRDWKAFRKAYEDKALPIP